MTAHHWFKNSQGEYVVKAFPGKEPVTPEITGTPNVPTGKATWYHGTGKEFEGFQAREGTLGTYLTTDRTYAEKYTSEMVQGINRIPRIIETSVTPKNTLDMRFGQADTKSISTLFDSMEHRAKTLANLDDITKSSAGERALKKLTTGRNEMLSASAVGQWKSGEAKLYDAAMDINKGEGDVTFASIRPLGEELQKLGYDSIRKVDDGADALVVLDNSIIRIKPPTPTTTR